MPKPAACTRMDHSRRLTRNKNGWLVGRLDVDRDAEVLEAFDEASGLRLLGSLVEVAGAEIVVFGAVLEHVVGSRQHRGCDRADGFLSAARARRRRNWACR